MTKAKTATSKPKIVEHQIDVTMEYDVFERMPGNRPVDEAHVLDLMRRMQKKDLFVPIQINQNFEVVDGQHRLEARKRLGIAVPFFCTSGYGLQEVQELNAQQKKWSIADFTDSFIERGNANYKIYKWFRSQYSLPHTLTVNLLIDERENVATAGQRSVRDIFQAGQLIVRDLEYAKSKAEMLVKIQPYFAQWNHRGFAQALFFCDSKRHFEFTRFLHRVETNPTMLKPCATTEQYIQLLEDVYNYRSPNKVSLRYGEDK